MPCLIKPDMHHTWLAHHAMLMWWLFTMLFVSFRVSSLVSFGFVPELWGFVRLHPFVFLHGLVRLPSGILGKMTIPSKSLLSLLAGCSLFCYAYAMIPTTCLLCLSYYHVKPLTHLVLANRCLAMLLLCSAPLIVLLVAGEDWSLFLVGTWILVGISQYLLFN